MPLLLHFPLVLTHLSAQLGKVVRLQFIKIDLLHRPFISVLQECNILLSFVDVKNMHERPRMEMKLNGLHMYVQAEYNIIVRLILHYCNSHLIHE